MEPGSRLHGGKGVCEFMAQSIKYRRREKYLLDFIAYCGII